MSVPPDAGPAPRILAPGADPRGVAVARGCLVAGDLVLTRALPEPVDGAYSVVFGADRQAYTARVLAHCRDDAIGTDAGLLHITDPGWAPPADYVPPRWGTFTGGIAWTAATIEVGAGRSVDVSPICWRRPARWDLRHGPSAGDAEHGEDGAPLFVGDILVGVGIRDNEGEAVRWTAVPVAEVARLPDFRKVIEEHTGRPPHLEPIECSGLLAPWEPVAPPRVAADLLDPRRAVAPFVEPVDGLDPLLDWCHGHHGLAGLLLTGPAGHGKTRLVREAANRLYARDWLVGEVAATTATEAWLRHLCAADRPALLVLDGSGALDLAEKITVHLGAERPRHPVRLLVTAVSADKRWTAWRERSQILSAVFAAEPLTLPGFDIGPDEARAAATAIRWGSAFARGLERLVDAGDLERRLAAPASRAFPAWAADGSPETAAVAALVALLTDAPVADAAMADEVLLADATDRWQRQCEPLGTEARRLAPHAIDLALVTRPADREEAVEVLAALTGRDGPAALLAPWVRALCPPAEPDHAYWGAPLPSRLRSRRLAVACADTEVTAALRRLSTDRLPYALARVAEAADGHEAPAGLIRDLVFADPTRFGPAAAAAVAITESPAPLVAALRDLVGRDDLPTAAATTLADAIPVPAGLLVDVEVTLRGRLTSEYRRAGEGGQRLAWSWLAAELVAYSRALAAAGRPADALAAAGEAVERHRRLGDVVPGPAAVRGLRTALRVLAERQLAMGQHGAAVDAVREATDVCRTAAATDPLFGPWLAADLECLGALRLDGGDAKGAVEAYHEAAREPLPPAAAGPVLCGLSDALAACGRHGAAAATIAEAATIYETLAGEDPRTYLRPFATSLEICAERLAAAGDDGAAVHAADRAVRAHRRLEDQHHDPRSTAYAEALRRLSDRYAGVGRGPDALAAAYESVARHRAAVEATGRAVSVVLCAALHTLARRYDEAGEVDYAADHAVEAAHGYRGLVERGQEQHRAALAGALSNAAVLRGRQGVLQESEPLARQALDAAARLDPAQVAGIRNNLAIVLGEAAERPGASRLVDESATLAAQAVRDLDGADPAAVTRALVTLASREAAAGRVDESVAAAERAVEACPDDPVLSAVARRTLVERYVAAERFGEAAQAAERAREACRRLVRMGLDRHRADLARLAMTHAGLPAHAVSTLAAAAAVEEAVLCYRALAAESPEQHREPLLSALDLSARLHAAMPGHETRAGTRLAEAVDLGAVLVGAAPRDHAAGQSARLRRLAERLRGSDAGGALAAAEQAYTLSQEVRDLASSRLELAASAALLARLLDDGDGARRLRLAESAVGWFEELAGERPDLHLADLAEALMFRAGLEARVGNDRKSAADAERALMYHREVAANLPDHRPTLAEALLARLKLPADGRLDSRGLLREAIRLYEELSQEFPERYLPILARVHIMLAGVLQRGERKAGPESLRHRRQGVDILADLTERGRVELGVEAVRELLTLITLLTKAGRDVEAQGLRRRASQINDLLGTERPAED